MYMLINKIVVNALNLKIQPIRKFDEAYSSMCARSYDSFLTTIYRKAKEEQWLNNSNHGGWFFIVEDDSHTIISKLYESEEAAEEARDFLLEKANKLVAKLFKVEI